MAFLPCAIFLLLLTLTFTTAELFYFFSNVHHTPSQPYLAVFPINSHTYKAARERILHIATTTTHKKGSPPHMHNFMIKKTRASLMYREVNTSYPSKELSIKDHELLIKASLKLATLVCPDWSSTQFNWRPLIYNCSPILVRSFPSPPGPNMDQASSSTSGIIVSNHPHAPTLLASSGIILIIAFLICGFVCCCSLSSSLCSSILVWAKSKKRNQPERNLENLSSILAATSHPPPRAGHH